MTVMRPRVRGCPLLVAAPTDIPTVAAVVEGAPSPATSGREDGDDGDETTGAGVPVACGDTGADSAVAMVISSWPASMVMEKMLKKRTAIGSLPQNVVFRATAGSTVPSWTTSS